MNVFGSVGEQELGVGKESGITLEHVLFTHTNLEVSGNDPEG